MSLIPIVCANCGAQYRLPATFTADKAKCKKCGAAIDVAGQREQPASRRDESAAAKPGRKTAGAPPRSSRAGRAGRDESGGGRSSRRAAGAKEKSTGKGKTEAPVRPSRRRGDDGDDEAGGRRGRGRQASSSNVPLVAGGIIVVLAAVLVVLVFVMQGGNEPTSEQTAKNDQGKAPAAEQQKSEEGTPDASQPDGKGPEAGAPVEGAAAGTADADASKKEPAKAEPAAKSQAKPKPKSEEMTAADAFKPKVELKPLPWPDSVTPEEQETIKGLLADVRDGGLPGQHAKAKLAEMGCKVFVGVANELRELNYFDSKDTMFAYELNGLLKQMSLGLNAGFRTQPYGEVIKPEDADWNGKTVKVWRNFAEKYSDPDAFQKLLETRKKAQSK